MEDISPFLHLFWTSGDVCPRYQSQGGSPCLCALLPTYNGILRFTSGATPADLLAASLTAEPFRSTSLQTSIGGGHCLIILKDQVTQVK